MAFQFDWDPAKAAYNKVEHGVVFESAITVFDDPGALENHDAAHSQTEERLIRVISARRANRKERRLYHEYQEHQTH